VYILKLILFKKFLNVANKEKFTIHSSDTDRFLQ